MNKELKLYKVIIDSKENVKYTCVLASYSEMNALRMLKEIIIDRTNNIEFTISRTKYDLTPNQKYKLDKELELLKAINFTKYKIEEIDYTSVLARYPIKDDETITSLHSFGFEIFIKVD